MLKHLLFTALFAPMVQVLVDTEAASATLETEVTETPAVVADDLMPEQSQMSGQDCFYGGGPDSNCTRCICVDAETREFQYYCSPCLETQW